MHHSIALGSSGLRSFRLFESADVNETRDRISRVLCAHTLTPSEEPRRRPAQVNMTNVRGITLMTIDQGTGMQVEARGTSDHHTIMLCLSGHIAARVNYESHVITSSNGIVGEPGWGLTGKLSADCEQFLVRIEAQSIAAHTGMKPRFRRLFDVRDPGLQPWVAQVQMLVNSLPLLRCLQDHDLAAVSMERALVALLMAGQPWVDTTTEDKRGIAPRCVRKAEAYMEECVGEPIRLADIAAAAGLPPRTLHEGFRRFRDYTPMQYLANLRLERAHQRLQQADDGTMVGQVALDCGFSHLSRFASTYRKRFGESPSTTLKRAIG